MAGTPLRIACTPADAFYYDALETGRVLLTGYRPQLCREPMTTLNRAALQDTYDVTAISAVVYPQVADRYAILSVGARVRRGHGPVLVSRRPCTPEELRGRRVGVVGVATTGCFLLRGLCPEVVPVETVGDRIAEAVAGGELDAGVLTHEESLSYAQTGLQRIADLGAEWCTRHSLPLPTRLNVIRRDLGAAALALVCAAILASLRQGARRRVALFAGRDTLWMSADVRTALRVLFGQVVDQGLAAQVPALDVVEGLQADTASPGSLVA